jgi:hypothetical protein
VGFVGFVGDHVLVKTNLRQSAPWEVPAYKPETYGAFQSPDLLAAEDRRFASRWDLDWRTRRPIEDFGF